MSNATEMHFAAQLLAREIVKKDVARVCDNKDLEYAIRSVRAYCDAFLEGRPRDLRDRIELAADVYQRVFKEMYGG